MNSRERRVRKLEVEMREPPGDWPAAVEAAKQYTLARAWRTLGLALDAADHPRVQWAMTLLQDDTPEQAALDLDTLQRWGKAHPDTLYPVAEGVRARFKRTLEEMARRLEAQA
jgi:hypothetical protein